MLAWFFAAQADLPPAFLDSFSEIRVALPTPQDVKGIQPVVRLDGQVVPTATVRPAGDPIRPRRLPASPGRVVLPGSFQSELGGRDWDPDGEVSQMTEVSPGVFELIGLLPEGTYEYKVARNGSWEENWGGGFTPGGGNLRIRIPKGGLVVRFRVDFDKKTIQDSVNHPEALTAPQDWKPEPDTRPATYGAIRIELKDRLKPGHVRSQIEVQIGDNRWKVFPREVLSDRAFHYDKSDLGARWSKGSTTFKLWAPTADKVELATWGVGNSQPMTLGANGVWYATVKGDLHRRLYTYRLTRDGVTTDLTDPYSFAANGKSTLSMVVDLARTNPPKWPSRSPGTSGNHLDRVLYEIHVRDYTVQKESGVKDAWRGKYAGLVQPGTTVPGTKTPTGLDYLRWLGVTDVHLLPIHNFTQGEGDPYSWGYWTNLFNVPEEAYASKQDDPVEVIREFKSMVAGMHHAGLRVVLDVVYNHTWPPQGKDSNFWVAAPYYFFRTNDKGDVLNESGVGNALADERPMVGKFVQDSLLYWLQEYCVDGFRFDLLGMHNPNRVKKWNRAVRAIRPDATLYGEPWTGGGAMRFGKGDQRGTGFAVFNDRFRGLVRGELDGPGRGLGMGADVSMDELWVRMKGSVDDFTDSPTEAVNYVSAHDNLTYWDKIERALPSAPQADKERAVRFSTALVLLAQGMPFLEGGVELGRTKGGDHNSYNAGDKVNQYDWKRGLEFSALANYTRDVIALRRSARDLRHGVMTRLTDTPPRTLAYRAGKYLVVINSGPETEVKLPAERWTLVLDGQGKAQKTVTGKVTIPNLSAWVLRKK